MRVVELMQTNLQTVGSDASIADAIALLSDTHVTGVPVVDGRGRVLGVLTTTDELNATAETAGAEERERLFEQTPAQEIITPPPPTRSTPPPKRPAPRSANACSSRPPCRRSCPRGRSPSRRTRTSRKPPSK